jgi:hypothetical protein
MALAAFRRRRDIQVVHCHLINVDTRYALTLKKMEKRHRFDKIASAYEEIYRTLLPETTTNGRLLEP